MKRDVDLLRKLLLQIEEREKPSWKDLTKDMSDSEAENVLQHINMLAEAGLIRGLRVPLRGFVLWQDLELTFEGMSSSKRYAMKIHGRLTSERRNPLPYPTWSVLKK